jgi:hypothetical protein
MCSDIAGLEEFRLAARGRVSVRARPRERFLARPRHHVHAERLAITRDRRADAAVAENAERLFAQRRTDADLPLAGFERRHLLRKLTRRRENERPCELGRSIRRHAGMLARRHDNAETRTGLDVDVRIDAALAD